MYQLAADYRPIDKTQLFVQTCTSMMPTAENMRLVRSATSLVRNVLNGGDIKPLRDLVSRAQTWCNDLDDVLAAAGQTVIDEIDDVSRVNLHTIVGRVAQIERDALASSTWRGMQGNVRAAYAG